MRAINVESHLPIGKDIARRLQVKTIMTPNEIRKEIKANLNCNLRGYGF